jgi:hypothetical protein
MAHITASRYELVMIMRGSFLLVVDRLKFKEMAAHIICCTTLL